MGIEKAGGAAECGRGVLVKALRRQEFGLSENLDWGSGEALMAGKEAGFPAPPRMNAHLRVPRRRKAI